MPLDRSPESTRWLALLIGVVSAIMLILSVKAAIHDGITGTAIYRHGPRGILRDPITRASAPEQFHEVTTKAWFNAGFYLPLASTGFYFYRKLSH